MLRPTGKVFAFDFAVIDFRSLENFSFFCENVNKLSEENYFMKSTIIFGNFITMDNKRPFAKAALIKNDVFAYIGDAEEAKKLAGSYAQVLDYGENFIPRFS